MRGIDGKAGRWTLAALALGAVAMASAPAASAQFLEPEVVVLRTHVAEEAGDGFGWVGERVGDIDGDGASEYLIGAPSNSAGGTLAGRAYLYSGADGTVLNVVTGSPFNRIGFAVGAPGDVNGDSVPDYATAGPATFGGPGAQPGRLLVLSGADHSVLLDVTGPGDLTFFGYDLNGVGDVNGDGSGDLVVGAPLDNTGGPRTGSIHVISGADGSTLWRADGPSDFTFLGTGVAGVDDYDGDGRPDVAAAGIGGGSKGVGEGYVYSGASGAVQRVLKSKHQYAGGSFGAFFVNDAGDTNADGVRDILIGDFSDNTTAPGAGAAYIFDGASEDRQIILGAAAGDGFGMSRSAGGDVDGDGHDDLLLGAYLESSQASQAGKAYIYSGRNWKLVRTMTGTVAGAQLTFDLAGLGDVNGDGLLDFLITGSGVAHVVAGNP